MNMMYMITTSVSQNSKKAKRILYENDCSVFYRQAGLRMVAMVDRRKYSICVGKNLCKAPILDLTVY